MLKNSRATSITQHTLDRQWECLSVPEVVAHLNSNLIAGLTKQEVPKRRKRFGFNQLTPPKKPVLGCDFYNSLINRCCTF